MGDSFQQFISNMKAAVIFISLLFVCSSHVIKKRSLLGGQQSHGHGHGHHGHHQQHQRQQHPARQPFGQRVGRDGDHHQDDSENEIRAAPTGYLPAEEYEEDLAEEAATRSEDLAGYGDDNLPGYETGAEAEERGQAQYANERGQYEDEQYQYDEASEEEELPEAGSASNIDNSYA